MWLFVGGASTGPHSSPRSSLLSALSPQLSQVFSFGTFSSISLLMTHLSLSFSLSTSTRQLTPRLSSTDSVWIHACALYCPYTPSTPPPAAPLHARPGVSYVVPLLIPPSTHDYALRRTRTPRSVGPSAPKSASPTRTSSTGLYLPRSTGLYLPALTVTGTVWTAVPSGPKALPPCLEPPGVPGGDFRSMPQSHTAKAGDWGGERDGGRRSRG